MGGGPAWSREGPGRDGTGGPPAGGGPGGGPREPGRAGGPGGALRLGVGLVAGDLKETRRNWRVFQPVIIEILTETSKNVNIKSEKN